MLQRIKITVHPEHTGLRADKFLAQESGLSRTRIAALAEEGRIYLADSEFTILAQKVKPGQEFTVEIPPAAPLEVAAVDIPLDILYEDADIIVINKSADLVVHPAAGHHDDTLVNALLYHCKGQLSGIGGVSRPGIVHRLDKDTSGVMVVAKTDKAHISLSEQFSAHTVGKIYLALVYGEFRPPHGTIAGNIARSPHNRQKMAVVKQGGREAVTDYKTVETYCDGAFSLVECTLHTGRTHQIRVHLSHNGHAIVGDAVYGGGHKALKKTLSAQVAEAVSHFPRQALHAWKLSFNHPVTGKHINFEAPLPEDMQELLKVLEK